MTTLNSLDKGEEPHIEREVSSSFEEEESASPKVAASRKKKTEEMEDREEEIFSMPGSKSQEGSIERPSFSEKSRQGKRDVMPSKKLSFLEKLTGFSFSRNQSAEEGILSRFMQDEEEEIRPSKKSSHKQGTLPGIEASDVEEDLEIPAFLRRGNGK